MVHIWSTSITNGCSAELGMPLLLQCFLYFFHMAITMLVYYLLLTFTTPIPEDLRYWVLDCKPLTPTTVLSSSLTRTILISYNAVHSLRKVS